MNTGRFAIYTLGCKVNQYESQAIEKEMIARGYISGAFDEVCDYYIINTCTVTAVGDKKSRNAIRRARRLNPNAVIGVCGCYAQIRPEELEKLDVDVISGTGERTVFVDRLEENARTHRKIAEVDDAFKRKQFEVLEPGGLHERTRAMLKVQDGCVNFCTYCIIPYARGALRSLSKRTAVAQTKQLFEAGYKEVVLTGIEIASWGRDLHTGEKLEDLILAVCEAVPEMRVRLGSVEPRIITDRFVELLKGKNNLCPQFHLSLQSGSDTVLQRMNRKYTKREYMESCNRLRTAFPECAVTTDLIVGFPQETEEEFQETLEFMKEVGFASMHIFPYSKRAGTPAAEMSGQVPKALKEERAARAGRIEKDMREIYQRKFVGACLPVLFEQETEPGIWCGHTMNNLLVKACGEDLHNRVLMVELQALDGQEIRGRIKEKPV